MSENKIPSSDDIISDPIPFDKLPAGTEVGKVLVASMIRQIFQEWIHYSQPCPTSRLYLEDSDDRLRDWQLKYEFIQKWFEANHIEKCKCLWCGNPSDDLKKGYVRYNIDYNDISNTHPSKHDDRAGSGSNFSGSIGETEAL